MNMSKSIEGIPNDQFAEEVVEEMRRRVDAAGTNMTDVLREALKTQVWYKESLDPPSSS